MSVVVTEVPQDSEVQVVEAHPIVLDMIAGLSHFIQTSSEVNCELYEMHECGCDGVYACRQQDQNEEVVVHSDEYIELVCKLYQEAGEKILSEGVNQWAVLDYVVTRLRAIEKNNLSRLTTVKALQDEEYEPYASRSAL